MNPSKRSASSRTRPCDHDRFLVEARHETARKLAGVERLDEKIVGAGAHGLDRGRDRTLAAHAENGAGEAGAAQRRHRFGGATRRIERHDGGRARTHAQVRDRLRNAFGLARAAFLRVQRCRRDAARGRIAIDNENATRLLRALTEYHDPGDPSTRTGMGARWTPLMWDKP